jgi:hypothetical protein
MNPWVDRWRTWLVCAVMGICLSVQPTHADPRYQKVPLPEGGISYEIMVHPVYITELHFPDDLTKVSISDQGKFLIHAMERRVVLRPKQQTAPGALANVLIESRTWRVMIMLRVAVHPSDAVVSVTFHSQEPSRDTGPTTGQDTATADKDATEADKPAAQADKPAAQPDKSTVPADGAADAAQPATQADAAQPAAPAEGTEAANDATRPQGQPSPDPAEQPAIVRAAPGEPGVSVQVNGTIGRAVIGDRMAGDQTDGLVLAGMAAHVAYPVGRYYAYDAGLTVAGSGMARFPGVMLDHDTGEMLRTMMLTRFELGASARLPVRLTPVVRVGLGVQGRALLASRLVLASGAAVEGPDDELIIDLTGSATVGIDYRITRAWRAGVGVTALRAVPLDNGPLFEAWEGSIHVRWN